MLELIPDNNKSPKEFLDESCEDAVEAVKKLMHSKVV